MEIDARGSEKSLSFCCLKIDNVFCVSCLTREGSAGLLVSAMNEMIIDAKDKIKSPTELEQKILTIKAEQLLGLEVLSKGNCIFIGGKTFVVSYQDTDFFSNDSHNLALYLKHEDKADKINQLFLSTCIRKSLSHKYSWGNSISNKKIQKDKVMIPIKSNEIDFDIMNTLISAVQKLVIKDVVEFANNKIEATKKIIDTK